MAQADVSFSSESASRIVPHHNIPVREDVAFTNAKGKEKRGIRKYAEKMLEQLAEPLRKALKKDEVVLFICCANTPMNLLEQWSFGVIAARYISRSALVVTNERLLQFRVTQRSTWTRSAREVMWSDLRQAKASGWFEGYLVLEYRNGGKDRYWGLASAAKGKLKAI